MTEAQYYLITKDELDEVFSFVQHAPEFTQDIEGEVLKRPAKESSDVLEELKKDVLNLPFAEGEEIQGWVLDLIDDKLAELRTKEREQG